jgi:hypothetical protein
MPIQMIPGKPMAQFQEFTNATADEDHQSRDIQDPASQVRVEVPAEPPQLNPQAAKALLTVLIKARLRQAPRTDRRNHETAHKRHPFR